jgi:ribosome maturation factor RimP
MAYRFDSGSGHHLPFQSARPSGIISALDYLCNGVGQWAVRPFFICALRQETMDSMMDLPARLEPVLAGLGYELVMLERAGRGLIRIFIDKPDGITIEDCVAVSNHLSHLFTVENIDYDRLEVSSPGLDRPLVKPQDYVRFAGEQVTLKLRVPMDNRRRLSGQLIGLENDAVKLIVDGTEVSVDLRNVDAAKLKPMV